MLTLRRPMSSLATVRRNPQPLDPRPSSSRGRAQWAALAVLALLVALGTSACGADTSQAEVADPKPVATGEVTFKDGWVKAAETGMSAAFGELVNGTDHDLTLVGVSSPASSMIQQHETLSQDDGSMAMQEVKDGFIVAAGSHHHLSPGGDHLMLMDLTTPIQAGDEVAFTLTFDDGSTLEVSLIARAFDGGDEEYHTHGDGDTGDMGADADS